MNLGSYNVAGLAEGMVAEQVHNAGWHSFLHRITVKAAEAGRRVVEVNPAGTIQHSLRGLEVRTPSTLLSGVEGSGLAVRVHRRPECGVVTVQLILRLGRRLASANAA